MPAAPLAEFFGVGYGGDMRLELVIPAGATGFRGEVVTVAKGGDAAHLLGGQLATFAARDVVAFADRGEFVEVAMAASAGIGVDGH